MIADTTVLAEVQRDWAAVRRIEKGLRGTERSYLSPAVGTQIQNTPAPDAAYNLPLVLAFAVLDKVLKELKNQGLFASGSNKLGAIMHASTGVLPWVGFALVNAGRDDRNNLAHEAIVVPRGDCQRYVDAIEAELVAWKVVLPPT